MNTVAASFNTAVRQTTKMSQQKRKPRLECYAKTKDQPHESEQK